MILVDMNQCMISNLMMQIKFSNELDENLVRHMVLNSIKSYKKSFSNEYGQLVLCYDSKFYWRKEQFPFYKQNRKKDREKSSHDWSKIFDVLNKIRDELRDHFPYIVMEIYGAEADDIISVLTKHTAIKNIKLQKLGNLIEKILILSGDKDFIQLSKYPCVKQYNPILKKFVKFTNPKEYLIEHIIKGDRSDGIPNFLSDDDTFISGKRQKPISKKNLVKWVTQEPEVFCNDSQLKNYFRNKKLIDLSCVPEDLEQKIVDEFELLNSTVKRKVTLDYFLNNKLTSLLNEIEDF
jgi:5'-3' exonuclease